MKPFFLSRFFPVFLLVMSACLSLQAQVRFRHYAPGCYYDHSGAKHTGFIDFGNSFFGAVKINFREDSITAANQRIDISEMKALVITSQSDSTQSGPGSPKLAGRRMVVDSFVVVQETEDGITGATTDARLCKFITDAVSAKIYSRNVKKSGPGFAMGIGGLGAVSGMVGASVSYMDTLYICEMDGKAVQIRRSNYKELLAKAFADYPELVQKIQNKVLRFGELNEIIRRYVSHKTA